MKKLCTIYIAYSLFVVHFILPGTTEKPKNQYSTVLVISEVRFDELHIGLKQKLCYCQVSGFVERIAARIMGIVFHIMIKVSCQQENERTQALTSEILSHFDLT